MDTITVTPQQAAPIIRDCIDADQPVMLWSAPGIGKSAIVEQVTKAAGRDMFTVLAHLKEAPDLSGYLVMTECRRDEPPVMTAPADLPATTHPTPSVLFLDEINGAPQDVQGSLYQLVQFGRLNNYRLPKDCARIAAGNRTNDRGVTKPMPTPLRNRFMHLTIEADREQWLAWAMQSGLAQRAPLIYSYHHFERNGLMVFDPKSDEAAFASPRSWEALSRYMAVNASPSLAAITGTIGTGQGTAFAGFCKVAAELPPAEMVFFSPDTAPIPREPSALFAVCGNLAAACEVQHMDAIVQYLDRLPDEYSALCMDIIRAKITPAVLMHLPAFTKWAQKHKYLF